MTAIALARKENLQSFARYEFKYILNQPLREEIEAEVCNFMSYDGHVDPEQDNTYKVRSLYFDNVQAAHYYEKTEGVKTRRKFRIRTYAERYLQGLPIFLEEKGRHNERTYKRRIPISIDHVPLFSDPEEGFVRLLDIYPLQQLVETFVFDRIRRRILPMVLIDYVRRPYTSVFDGNFRLTFDSHLTAIATNELFPDEGSRCLQCVAGKTILEVKFDRRIPAWFHRILQAYDMRRLSISKFCKGMEVCGLAVDLS